MNVLIYALIDPNSYEIRYIGKCNENRLDARYCEHLRRKRKENLHKERWINKLQRNNQKPIIEILEVCNQENWQDKERYWISLFDNLTNISDGGIAPNPLFGSAANGSKLDDNKVKTIIKKYKETNLSTADLAKEYNVSQGTIADIITGKTWKHITNGIKTTSEYKKYKRLIGMSNKHAKLTNKDVLEIRELRKQKVKLKTLSNTFGVSESVISMVARELKWQHVN